MKSTKAIVIPGPQLKADAQGQLPNRIEICHEGKWNTPYHGDFELAASDFYEAKGHFDSGHYRADDGAGSLPAGLDHFTGPAAYWIDGLEVAPSAKVTGAMSLWANISWSDLGREKVERDEYRYTSMEYNHRGLPLENPEVKGQFWVNVLTGSTLTNDPLLKKLSKVLASARAGSDNNNQGDSMKLEDVRTKKAEDLTDDEKKFLEEHKAELTADERKSFGLEETVTPKDGDQDESDDTPPTPKEGLGASARNMVPMTKEEVEQLRADAAAGRKAQLALERAEIKRGIEAHAKAGRIKTAEIDNVTDLMVELNASQRDKLTAAFNAIPKNPLLAGEAGHAEDLEASVSVTEEEKKLAASFGNSTEDIEKFKKAEAERI